MSEEELNDELFEEIQRCPEKYFTQYLYGADKVGVIDLLNRLVQSKNGFEVAIECLSCWQDMIGVNYCLEPISAELQQTENAQIICLCLSFINRLLENSPNAIARIRIDHELKELNVNERVSQLRTLLNSGTFGEFDGEISEQIGHWQSEHLQNGDIFIRARSSSLIEPEDSNSFTEESEEEEYRMASVETAQSPVWNSDLKKGDVSLNGTISPKPEDTKYLDDPRYMDSILVQLVNLLKGKTDSIKRKQVFEALLRIIPRDIEMAMNSIGKEMMGEQQKEENNGNQNEFIKASSVRGVALTSAPPPPPPPPPLSGIANGPPPPPPLLLTAKGLRLSPKTKVDIPKVLKPKAMPKAGSKMKQIQWTKIPVEKVIGDGMQKIRNVWMSSARLPENELHLNFEELESMFSCASTGSGTDTPSTERRTVKKNDVITLLSHKRSFNVSIFLKRFKEGIFQIIENIREGNGEFFGLERLNGLRAILPDNEEIDILRGFSGDRSQLGTAEQFFLSLISVPDYKLVLDCMILKEELDIAFETLLPQIDIVISGCKEIKGSKALPKIFCMLVQIGNFLNANATFGNAAGFKLNSLWRILDLKATQKSITLLHFIAMQDPECTKNLFNELSTVPAAAKLSMESIRTDFRSLSDKLTSVRNEVTKRNDVPFFEEANQHFMNSRDHMENMEERLGQMDKLISYLAAYFCEDEKQFKIEECFKILSTFSCRLRDALNDNEQRTIRLMRREERSNIGNILERSSSELDLSPKINNKRTLEELLESDAHVDSRHSRSRSNINNISTPNIVVVKPSEEEQGERKVVHRTVRKLRNEMLDEADDMSPIVKLRRQSRNKSDAYLIRNSKNLDEFLEVAERVEKEATRQHVEYNSQCYTSNKEAPQELLEIPSTLSACTGDISSASPSAASSTSAITEPENLIQQLEPSGRHNILEGTHRDAPLSDYDDRLPTTPGSVDKKKKRVEVERAAEIPLTRTIRSVRTQKSVEKKIPAERAATESPRTSPSLVKQLSATHSSRTTLERGPITKSLTLRSPKKVLQSITDTSIGRQEKGRAGEQVQKNSYLKPSRIPFTMTAPKETVLQRQQGTGGTTNSKMTEMTPLRGAGNTRSRTPRASIPDTVPSSSSSKSTTPRRGPRKPTYASNAEVPLPSTSNSSAETSPQRQRAAAGRVTSNTKENFGSQSFWGPAYRASPKIDPAKSITSTKGVLRSRENTPRPVTAQSEPSSTHSRRKSAPNRTAVVSATAAPTPRVTPLSRTSPSTPRRTVKSTVRPGSQVPQSTSAAPGHPSRTMKRADSCSTASRPLLIKTGSEPRPRWK